MANPEHVDIVKQGKDAIDQWRILYESTLDLSNSNLSKIDLSLFNLSGANLSGANLYKTNLAQANLIKANLYKANLRKANLYEARIYEANLSKANLKEANLYQSNLFKANLSKANLSKANLNKSILSDSDLTEAKLYKTSLENVHGLFKIPTSYGKKDIFIMQIKNNEIKYVMIWDNSIFRIIGKYLGLKTYIDRQKNDIYLKYLNWADQHNNMILQSWVEREKEWLKEINRGQS